MGDRAHLAPLATHPSLHTLQLCGRDPELPPTLSCLTNLSALRLSFDFWPLIMDADQASVEASVSHLEELLQVRGILGLAGYVRPEF